MVQAKLISEEDSLCFGKQNGQWLCPVKVGPVLGGAADKQGAELLPALTHFAREEEEGRRRRENRPRATLAKLVTCLSSRSGPHGR